MKPKQDVKKDKPPILANWGRRFIAWFVDYFIIILMFGYFQLEAIETRIFPAALLPKAPGTDISIWSPLSILIFFLYFTFSEWYFGRSIGQLLLNIRLVDVQGAGVNLRASAIQSVGKSNPLLLLFDFVIGQTYRPSRERRQRLFNRVSNTIVIFIGEPTRTIQQQGYLKEP
ncbi:MAG TPA: RDD family protein [Methylomirabilota bacterium]|nr:RDD family protein [Methylomirabilota bacterium]